MLLAAAKDELRRDLGNAPMWLQAKLKEIVADWPCSA